MGSSLLARPNILQSSGIKTQGEMEAAVCDGMSRFHLEYMGKGPKDILAHLLGNLLVIRLRGVLTAAEQNLMLTQDSDRSRDLLKQVRTQLIEHARPKLDALVHGITGVRPCSLHHDISTNTGEEIVVFTLADQPVVRECKSRR